MPAIGIGIGIPFQAAGRGFDASDIENGTLHLNFVDRLEYTLRLDFIRQEYEVAEEDSVIAGPVGYFLVKG